jgi:hypothetical protein
MFHSTALALANGVAPTQLYGDPGQSCAGAHNVITYTAFGASSVPAGRKASTWIWLPDDNNTLSNLPWGLKRYVGEEAFDLVVVNDTSSVPVSSDAIPLPWGGFALGLELSPGLNQILVPRAQFMSSLFAQAVLLDQRSQNASRLGGPLLLGNETGAVTNASHGSNLTDLECYWQSRAVNQGPNLCPGGAGGTASNTTYTLNLVYDSSCSSGNCGGLPSDATLENASDAGASIQTIVALNVTSSGQGTGTQQLDALIASLLVNVTGIGQNGTLESVSSHTLSLGFSPAVVKALANSTQYNGGQFGYPVSRATPPQPPPSFLATIWNSVSGVAAWSGVGVWLGAAWGAARAAGQYLLRLAVAALRFGESVASRAVSALAAIGAVLLTALQWLEKLIIWLVKQTLTPLIKPVLEGVKGYAAAIGAAFQKASVDQSGTGITTADIAQIWDSICGSVFLVALGIGALEAIALTIAEPLDFGPTFVGGIVLGMIVQGFSSSLGVLSGITGFTSATLAVLESFFAGVPQICSFFTAASTWSVFSTGTVIAGDITGFGLAAYIAYYITKEYTKDQNTQNRDGAIVFAFLAALSFVSLILDAAVLLGGMYHSSMGWILLLSFGLSSITVLMALIHLGFPSVAPTSADFGLLAAIGGFTMAGDVGLAISDYC